MPELDQGPAVNAPVNRLFLDYITETLIIYTILSAREVYQPMPRAYAVLFCEGTR